MGDIKKKNHEGNIREKKPGLYEGRITVGGKSKSVYGSSAVECRRKIIAFKKECENGLINPKTDTIYDFITKWLRDYKYDTLEESSYDRLESLLEHQIKGSKIQSTRLGDLTTEQLQRFLVELGKPVDQNRRPYAWSTVKKVYELLNSVYRFAEAKKMITYNPMIFVKMPKESKCLVPKKDTFSLSPGQIQIFKEACLTKTKAGAYKYRYGLILLLILNLGLRVGEMLALRFDDIDEELGEIHITKSLQSNVKNRNSIGNKRISNIKTTKTKNSMRMIPYNESVKWIINEIMADNRKRGIVTDLVCSSETGGRATARNLQRTLDTIVAKTDLPHIWLHILRHTFGSELIRQGINVSVVSKLMGHADINITYRTYIHVIESETRKAMNKVSIA